MSQAFVREDLEESSEQKKMNAKNMKNLLGGKVEDLSETVPLIAAQPKAVDDLDQIELGILPNEDRKAKKKENKKPAASGHKILHGDDESEDLDVNVSVTITNKHGLMLTPSQEAPSAVRDTKFDAPGRDTKFDKKKPT